MGKLFSQLAGLLFLFFGMWFLLSQIPFTSYYNFKELGKRNEQALADVMLNYIKLNSESIEESYLDSVFVIFKNRICDSSSIASNDLQLHLLNSSEVNAFALPASNMVILSGLIDFCETPEELTGIMAHELAHIEHNHVTSRMIKELGFTVVMAMISGNSSGGQTVKEAVKMVSSSAFDRSQEVEADETAVKILVNSGIDPQHLANFFERLAEREPSFAKNLTWVSTHPDTKERAASVMEFTKNYSITVREVISEQQWSNFKEMVRKAS
jgi:predicted Zn-dependent protease